MSAARYANTDESRPPLSIVDKPTSLRERSRVRSERFVRTPSMATFTSPTTSVTVSSQYCVSVNDNEPEKSTRIRCPGRTARMSSNSENGATGAPYRLVSRKPSRLTRGR